MAHDIAVENGQQPVHVTLAAAVKPGELIGYSSGWVKSNAAVGTAIPAELIAGQRGEIGETITCYRRAVLWDRDAPFVEGSGCWLGETGNGEAGGVTSTVPTTIGDIQQMLGVATSTERLIVDCQRISTLTLGGVPTGRTASKVVASSSATLLQQAQADYRCTGTADDVQIQLAIDALALIGGTVGLVGMWFWLAATLCPKSGVSLKGEGMGATFMTPADGAIYTAIGVPVADSGTANAAVTSTDTTLRDTRKDWVPNALVGYHATCNDKRLTVTSNTPDTLTGTAWAGGTNPGNGHAWTLQLPASYCTISDMTFDGNASGQAGGSVTTRGLIDFTYMPNVRFENVRATNGYDNGFYRAVNTHTAEHTRIVDCEADHNGQAGVEIGCSHAVRISRTDAHHNTTFGFSVGIWGFTDETAMHIDGGCHSYSNGGTGIRAIASGRGVIENAVVYLNGGDGVDLTDSYCHTLIGNTITYNTGVGVREATSGGYHTYLGNDVQHNTAGNWLVPFYGTDRWGANAQYAPPGTVGAVTCWVTKDNQTVNFPVTPPNTRIVGIDVYVAQAVNRDGTDLISIGYSGDHANMMAALDVSTTGLKTAVPGSVFGSVGAAGWGETAYYVAGGSAPTTGKCSLTARWVAVEATP